MLTPTLTATLDALLNLESARDAGEDPDGIIADHLDAHAN